MGPQQTPADPGSANAQQASTSPFLVQRVVHDTVLRRPNGSRGGAMPGKPRSDSAFMSSGGTAGSSTCCAGPKQQPQQPHPQLHSQSLQLQQQGQQGQQEQQQQQQQGQYVQQGCQAGGVGASLASSGGARLAHAGQAGTPQSAESSLGYSHAAAAGPLHGAGATAGATANPFDTASAAAGASANPFGTASAAAGASANPFGTASATAGAPAGPSGAPAGSPFSAAPHAHAAIPAAAANPTGITPTIGTTPAAVTPATMTPAATPTATPPATTPTAVAASSPFHLLQPPVSQLTPYTPTFNDSTIPLGTTSMLSTHSTVNNHNHPDLAAAAAAAGGPFSSPGPFSPGPLMFPPGSLAVKGCAQDMMEGVGGEGVVGVEGTGFEGLRGSEGVGGGAEEHEQPWKVQKQRKNSSPSASRTTSPRTSIAAYSSSSLAPPSSLSPSQTPQAAPSSPTHPCAASPPHEPPTYCPPQQPICPGSPFQRDSNGSPQDSNGSPQNSNGHGATPHPNPFHASRHAAPPTSGAAASSGSSGGATADDATAATAATAVTATTAATATTGVGGPMQPAAGASSGSSGPSLSYLPPGATAAAPADALGGQQLRGSYPASAPCSPPVHGDGSPAHGPLGAHGGHGSHGSHGVHAHGSVGPAVAMVADQAAAANAAQVTAIWADQQAQRAQQAQAVQQQAQQQALQQAVQQVLQQQAVQQQVLQQQAVQQAMQQQVQQQQAEQQLAQQAAACTAQAQQQAVQHHVAEQQVQQAQAVQQAVQQAAQQQAIQQYMQAAQHAQQQQAAAQRAVQQAVQKGDQQQAVQAQQQCMQAQVAAELMQQQAAHAAHAAQAQQVAQVQQQLQAQVAAMQSYQQQLLNASANLSAAFQNSSSAPSLAAVAANPTMAATNIAAAAANNPSMAAALMTQGGVSAAPAAAILQMQAVASAAGLPATAPPAAQAALAHALLSQPGELVQAAAVAATMDRSPPVAAPAATAGAPSATAAPAPAPAPAPAVGYCPASNSAMSAQLAAMTSAGLASLPAGLSVAGLPVGLAAAAAGGGGVLPTPSGLAALGAAFGSVTGGMTESVNGAGSGGNTSMAALASYPPVTSPVTAAVAGPLAVAGAPAVAGGTGSTAVSVLPAVAVSVASSNLGGTVAPSLAGVTPTSTGAAVPDEKIKMLVQVGGVFSRSPNGCPEYVGGETRLVGVKTSLLTSGPGVLTRLLAHMSSSTGLQLDQSCTIKYELLGSRPVTYVDLINDDDVANMWEVYQEFTGGGVTGGSAASTLSAASAALKSTKLRVCVEQPENSDGSFEMAPMDHSATTTSNNTASPAGGSVAGSGGGGQSGGGPDGQGGQQATAAGKASADAGSVGGTSGTGGTGFHHLMRVPSQGGDPSSRGNLSDSSVTLAALGDSVTNNPQVALSELEARLEVLKPEDLRVCRFLGAGGYGEVYLCKWASVDVAVKSLNPSLLTGGDCTRSTSSDAVAELIREALTLSRLRHPNVVWVYGVVLPAHLEGAKSAVEKLNSGQQIDAVSFSVDAAMRSSMLPGMVRPPALVTEYMAGGSVRAALNRKADFLRPPAVRVKLALDTARGLEYLHAKKIVHFDLKSANVLVGWREGVPAAKVADFGLSKQRQQTYVTGVTSLRGTLPWTAPEIIATPKAVTEKVDVYSFGIMMWELETGREPFDGLNYHALLHQMTTTPGGFRPPLPGAPDWEGPPVEEPAPGWQSLMCRCWAEDPAARPPFSEVVPRLQAMLAAVRVASSAGGTGGTTQEQQQQQLVHATTQ